MPDADERAWLRPRLGVLLGIGASATFSKEELYAAWAAFLERVGSDGPVVLVIDDAQHADDGLLDFLDHLLSRATFGLFVLLLARPGVLARRAELAANRRVTVLHVDGLDAADMGELVDGLVTGLPEPARAALVSRAEGIPLFAVETVRSLIDRDLVIPRDGRYVLADDSKLDLDAIAAPASLQTLISARLDALDEAERRVVADASVLGVTMPIDDLQAVVNDVDDFDDVVSSLVHKQILAVETDRFSAERGQLRFVQTVVRQVAYDTLSRRDRRARHLAVASQLELGPRAEIDAAVIAQHYLDAVRMSGPEDPDNDELRARALRLLEAAARRASKVGSPSAGVRYLEAALEFAEADSDRARLLESAAQAAVGLRALRSFRAARRSEAIEIYVSAGDDIGAGRTAAIEGRSLNRLGNPSGGIELMLPHWQRLKEHLDADDAVQPLANAISASYQERGDFALSLEYTFRALTIAEAHGDLEAMARSYTSLAYYLLTVGAPRLGMLLIERTAELGREIGDPAVLARALMAIGVEKRAEEPMEGLRIGREALTSAELSGVQTIIEMSQVNLLLALWISGEWDELDATLAEVTDPTAGMEVYRVAVGQWLAEARQQEVPFSAPQELRPEADEVVHRAWWSHLELLEKRSDNRLTDAVLAGADSVDQHAGLHRTDR